MKEEAVMDLENNLLIFYSGIERSASQVLNEQKKTITENKDDAVNRMHRIKQLGYDTKKLLEDGNIDSYGELLHEHWMNKRKLASNMTSGPIDEHYEAARKGEYVIRAVAYEDHAGGEFAKMDFRVDGKTIRTEDVQTRA